jgi:NAD(P)-dependent dehydrogenase (short-subunit alcohol dehydrogenase family)
LASPDRPSDLLRGRVAVVTGGGRGLGKTLVEALAAAGADVAFSPRGSRAGAQEAARAVASHVRRAFTARADARQPGELAAFVDQAAGALGGIDVLVNNASAPSPKPSRRCCSSSPAAATRRAPFSRWTAAASFSEEIGKNQGDESR